VIMRSLVLLCLLGLAACESQPSREPMHPNEPGKTLVYECGDYEFVARTGPGEIALYLPSGYRVLGQVRAASGTKYAGEGVEFWSKGNSATLDLGSRILGSCRLNPARAPWEDARRRGVDFRAVGQEPGWYLEIQHGRQILFVGNYGGNRLLLPTPDPELDGELATYSASGDSHELLVEVTVEHCQDSMSGEIFDNSVRVVLDGREYRGCGLVLDSDWE
jgi:putative lipoprotein